MTIFILLLELIYFPHVVMDGDEWTTTTTSVSVDGTTAVVAEAFDGGMLVPIIVVVTHVLEEKRHRSIRQTLYRHVAALH